LSFQNKVLFEGQGISFSRLLKSTNTQSKESVSLKEDQGRREEMILTRVLDTRREVSTVLVLDVFEMGLVFISHRLGVEETDKNWSEREKRELISILFLEMRWAEFFSSSIYRILLLTFFCLVVEYSVYLLLPDLSIISTRTFSIRILNSPLPRLSSVHSRLA